MALLILEKELSRMVMSLTSLARAVPSPIERPTWAFLNAKASFVPSPVTATTSPHCCKRDTRRALSSGLALDRMLRPGIIFNASSSDKAAKSLPVMLRQSPSLSSPNCLPISCAVAATSPVTIITLTPAFRQVSTASLTSSRIGSAIPTTPAITGLSSFSD